MGDEKEAINSIFNHFDREIVLKSILCDMYLSGSGENDRHFKKQELEILFEGGDLQGERLIASLQVEFPKTPLWRALENTKLFLTDSEKI